MTSTITLHIPTEVYALLDQAHPKGATAAAQQAIKRYLNAQPKTRPNAGRDAEIADKFVAGTPQVQLAKAYGLSYIRIQQIVAKGRADAYIRQDAKLKSTIQNIFDQP